MRVTGSGLGCPDWPTCDAGRLTPHPEQGIHGWIEQLNRYFTGLIGVIVCAGVLASLVRKPRRKDLTLWSLSLVAGVVAQAVLGGLSVLYELNPYFVMAHFLLSQVLLWFALILHRRARQPDGAPRAIVHRDYVWLGRAIMLLTAVVLVIGTIVTGSGPHGGEEGVRRFGFQPHDITKVHGAFVWLLILLAAVTVWRLHAARAEPTLVKKGEVVMAALLVQGAIGYFQYALDVPAALVLVHIAGATAVWASVVWFNLSFYERWEPVGIEAFDGDERVSAVRH